jgi:hypothetical protein
VSVERASAESFILKAKGTALAGDAFHWMSETVAPVNASVTVYLFGWSRTECSPPVKGRCQRLGTDFCDQLI